MRIVFHRKETNKTTLLFRVVHGIGGSRSKVVVGALLVAVVGVGW